MPGVTVTEAGTVEVTVPVATSVQVHTGSTGPAGPTGPKGDTGATGADGQDGTNGTNGAAGAKGDKGDKGDPGVDGTDGTNGSDGAPGADGADGVGVPVGGTTGQVLAKVDGTDFNTTWVDQSGGGGGILTITGDTEIAVDATDPDNIVLSIGASIARGSDVTTAIASEATLARNGDNITSGTVADARIASTIARDSEVTTAVGVETSRATAAEATLISKSIVNAKGDIITATADDTPSILSAGSNGKVLSANSGAANGIEWVTPTTLANDPLWNAAGDLAYASADNTGAILAIGSTGKVLTVSSGLPAWVTPLNIATDTVWAAKGDLIIATANDTAAVLGIGTAGQVLTVSGGTAVWADAAGGGTVSSYAWNGSAYASDSDVRIFTGPGAQNPKTATGGRNQANDIWITTDAFASIPGQILSQTVYNPGTQANLSTTSSTFADVDATNLSVSFTAPASGSVLITMEGLAVTGAATTMNWNVRESTSDLSGTTIEAQFGAFEMRRSATVKVSGLTPGSSHTYKWGFARSAGVSTCQVSAGGASIGPALLTITAL